MEATYVVEICLFNTARTDNCYPEATEGSGAVMSNSTRSRQHESKRGGKGATVDCLAQLW